MKSNAEMSENRFLGSISASSIRSLLHRSVSTKHKTNSTRSKSGPDGENNPPIDPNILLDKDPIPKQSLSKHEISQREITKSDSQKEVLSPPADPPVKVVVRIRPANGHEREGDQLVRKLSDDSVAAEDKKFTFDSVLDSKSNQEYVFQLVGVPLVKNALAGYNTTILAYGQAGSGKSYTMWGPPSAMVENQASNSHQGIVPRIFQMLFSEIQRIYNEQIGDLLDPTQRNLEVGIALSLSLFNTFLDYFYVCLMVVKLLQIRDDTKHGFYVENLTEEYVTSYEDITQILIKVANNKAFKFCSFFHEHVSCCLLN
ncbi:hypothetical protein HYC85_014894 [Camellia sinensis]|uniref:Kinesin motor domain-containing protein n=1 Tax=Camellia sinensis TaxID=4442 RepID=A0A7J7H8P5_CAMSI|nr:hypothetical protein HYC85_014894 [Camellia sinensis]